VKTDDLSNCDRCHSADGIHEAGTMYLCDECYEWWQAADPSDVWRFNIATFLRDYLMLEAAMQLFVNDDRKRRLAKKHPIMMRAISTARFLVHEPGPDRDAVLGLLLRFGQRGS